MRSAFSAARWVGPRSSVQGPRSEVQGPRSEVKVQGSRSEVQGPRSEVRFDAERCTKIYTSLALGTHRSGTRNISHMGLAARKPAAVNLSLVGVFDPGTLFWRHGSSHPKQNKNTKFAS